VWLPLLHNSFHILQGAGVSDNLKAIAFQNIPDKCDGKNRVIHNHNPDVLHKQPYPFLFFTCSLNIPIKCQAITDESHDDNSLLHNAPKHNNVVKYGILRQAEKTPNACQTNLQGMGKEALWITFKQINKHGKRRSSTTSPVGVMAMP
jgi:hypothetical protein